MCSNNPGSMIPYGLKVPSLSPYMPLGTALTQLPLDFHRAHLYDYNARLQYGLRGHPTALGLSPYAHAMDTLGHPYVFKQDLRARYIHEEPKPSHSYIGLIAMAILSHKDKKLVLSDIYQWILDNYAYFRTRGPGWRNSIRHNLSLNDCFIKSGRSANGKGHYWAIHPANLEDFQKGDFRRRRAQRRVRKHMGLSVPEDEDSSSPAPASSPPAKWTETAACRDEQKESSESLESVSKTFFPHEVGNGDAKTAPLVTDAPCVKKRLFDVESLLAPETKRRPSKEDFSRGIAERNNNNTHSTVKVDTKDFSEKILKCEHDIDITASQNTRHQGDINSSGLMSSQIAKSIDELQKLGSGTSDGISSKPDPTYASAFHSMLPSTWSALSTYAYPIMSGTHYSITVPVSTFAGATKKWPSNFSDLGRRPSPEKEVQVDV